jgi:hypothetical protein
MKKAPAFVSAGTMDCPEATDATATARLSAGP